MICCRALNSNTGGLIYGVYKKRGGFLALGASGLSSFTTEALRSLRPAQAQFRVSGFRGLGL